jgi:hypothetical protein
VDIVILRLGLGHAASLRFLIVRSSSGTEIISQFQPIATF